MEASDSYAQRALSAGDVPTLHVRELPDASLPEGRGIPNDDDVHGSRPSVLIVGGVRDDTSVDEAKASKELAEGAPSTLVIMTDVLDDGASLEDLESKEHALIA